MTGDLLDRAISHSEIDRDDLARILEDVSALVHTVRAISAPETKRAAVADQPRLGEGEVGDRVLRGRLAAHIYLNAQSLSVAEAAARINKERSGLQHRISRGTLCAFNLGGGLRVPTWQLVEGGYLPHLKQVLMALRPQMSPLEMNRLMRLRHDELEEQTIPAWLSAGRGLGPVLSIIEATNHR